MPLHQIDPRILPQVWPIVAPLLQKAIDVAPSEITIEQTEYLVRTGRLFLVVWEEPDVGITGAATVEFIDYPRERVGHISLTGGKGVATNAVFPEILKWMRLYGATKAQCWAFGSHVKLYEKLGMTNAFQVMRIEL